MSTSRERVPARYRAHPPTAAILDALLPRATQIAQLADDLLAQCIISTATWSLPLWEEKYGLLPDDTLTDDERRAQVIAAMAATGVTNEAVIEALASTLSGYAAHVAVDATNYAFTIYFSGNSNALVRINRARLLAAIERIKPAHLRCIVAGITWADVEAAQLTWAYLDEHQITWTDAEYCIPLHAGA